MSDVAGYHVVRTLSRRDGRELLLGFDGDDTVVLVRFASECEPREWSHELEALSRAAGEHVVRLLDVGSDDGVITLVLERLTGGRLAQLLRDRGSLEAGELVTLLVPLAATLERLHAAGVAHGAFRPGNVMFTAEGSPTLVGFGRAQLFTPGAPEVVRETVAGVADDRDGLRRLALELLGRVRAGDAEAARELAIVVETAPPDQLCRVIADRLFGLGPAVPVLLAADADDADVGFVTSRLIPVIEAVPPDTAADTDAERAGPLSSGHTPRLWESIEARFAPVLELDPVVRVRAIVSARWSALPPQRRRVVVGAAAGVAVLVVALAALPPADPTAIPETADTETSDTAVSAATPPSAGPSPTSTADADIRAIEGDDPVAASSVLLAQRARCLRLASLLCLEGVTQSGSAAAAADRAIVQAVQAGGEPPEPISAEGPRLVERLGDSALIALDPEPRAASLLLMKGEAGWRIRDYLAASGAVGP